LGNNVHYVYEQDGVELTLELEEAARVRVREEIKYSKFCDATVLFKTGRSIAP
jgi:hypothetical protein